MKKLHFNLSAEAWRTLRQAWHPRWSPSLAWQSHVTGSVLSRTYALQCANTAVLREKADLHQALVVLGYWRSGTTLLHELLNICGDWACPSTHACMNPQSFALDRGHTDLSASVQRPMDDMVIRGDSPQEDDFAMLCLGGRTPYEGVLFPEHLAEAMALTDFAALSAGEQSLWQSRYRDFIATVSGQAGGKKLLLKSPPHGGRIPMLLDTFPDARFVHIVRNPYEVFESCVRMWIRMMQCYALGPIPDEAVIRQAVLDHRPGFEACQRAGMAKIAPDKCVTIHFEDLADRPAETIGGIWLALQLGDAGAAAKSAGDEMARRAHYKKKAAQVPQPWHDKIREQWADIFTAYGYPG